MMMWGRTSMWRAAADPTTLSEAARLIVPSFAGWAASQLNATRTVSTPAAAIFGYWRAYTSAGADSIGPPKLAPTKSGGTDRRASAFAQTPSDTVISRLSARARRAKAAEDRRGAATLVEHARARGSRGPAVYDRGRGVAAQARGDNEPHARVHGRRGDEAVRLEPGALRRMVGDRGDPRCGRSTGGRSRDRRGL